MKLLLLGVWLAAAVVAASCAADDPVGDAADAAVGVRATGCGLVDRLGTGALVDAGDRDLIVTSAHTVAGAASITVERHTRRSEVELLAIDPERDIAVLSTPGWTEPGRRLDTTPSRGEAARLAVWNPDESMSVSETTITRLLRVTIEDIYVEGEYERRAFELDATVIPGNSGGPVVADDGSVLGIVYARSRARGGVAFAVSAVEVADVVADAGTDPAEPGRCA